VAEVSTENSENKFAMAQAIRETLASRFLVEYPNKGWRLFSVNRVSAAYRGKLLLPDLANQTVRVAFADVAVRNGRPVALYSLELAEWRVDGEGRVDQTALMSRITEKLNMSTETQQKRSERDAIQVSNADLEAICLALKFPPAN
jgi:hypothetical protein